MMNGEDINRFLEFLIKANDLQLMKMQLELQREINKRDNIGRRKEEFFTRADKFV